MKRISIATLATLGLAILACGGGDEEAAADGTTTGTTASTTAEPAAAEPTKAADMNSVPLSDPWKSMDLPVNNGTVLVSDKTHLLVAYDSGAISTYTTSYGQQIDKQGWTKKDDYSESDFTAVLYSKGSQELGFAVGTIEGKTVVYFEDLDGVAEEDRVVKRGNRAEFAKKVQKRPPPQRKQSSSSSSSTGKSKGKGKGKGKKGKGKGKGKKRKGGKKKR